MTSNFTHFKIHEIKLHATFWLIYIIYEVFILGLVSNQFKPVEVYVLVYFGNISVFYLNAYLFRKILKFNNRILFATNILLLLLIDVVYYTLITYALILFFKLFGLMESNRSALYDINFILSCIYRSLLFIGYSITYVFISKSFEDQKKVQELERVNLENQIERQALENNLIQSQNNYLRSQINPHFLFNTLNFIYNDARKKAPLAADAIMNLAEMMRYALKRPDATELVPLREEIEQIEHLINLHKLRTANAINLNLYTEGELFTIKFPPLILLTLVENMFKHGNISHNTQAAEIKIIYEDDSLSITTINMVNDNKGKQTESHHVGIENINKRLSNFYGEEYMFRYYKDPLNRFITEIEVRILNPLAKLNQP